MAHGDSSKAIRQRALQRFIEPARREGHSRFSIVVKPLMSELEAEGFPKNRPAQFCAALQKESFLEEQGIVLERVEGPPSGKSTTVVLHCRFKNLRPGAGSAKDRAETPSERAVRVTESLRGFLKSEIDALGGAKGYMKWVRREDAE